MKRFVLFALAAAGLLLGGCFPLGEVKTPPVPAPKVSAAQAAAAQKAKDLKEKKKSSPSMPATLGGVVSSDKWVVYQEKQEEEFEGHVHYDNGVYVFTSDYALSQRAKNLFTAKGRVYARKNEPDGAWYELYADKAVYNYQTGAGSATAAKKKKIKLVWQNAQKEVVTAHADRADFNTKKQTAVLSGGAFVTRKDAQGQVSALQADRISARREGNHLILQGNAEVHTPQYSLKAQTLEYNGAGGFSQAYGGRALMEGTTQDGTFAIIADKAEAENESRKIKLSGRVQGWVVSDELNQAAGKGGF